MRGIEEGEVLWGWLPTFISINEWPIQENATNPVFAIIIDYNIMFFEYTML